MVETVKVAAVCVCVCVEGGGELEVGWRQVYVRWGNKQLLTGVLEIGSARGTN